MKNKVLIASLLALFTNLGAFSFVERQNVQPTSNIVKTAGEMQQLITPQQIAEEIEMAEILAPAVEAGVEAAEAEESAEEKMAEKEGWSPYLKRKLWTERGYAARAAAVAAALYLTTILAGTARGAVTGGIWGHKYAKEIKSPEPSKLGYVAEVAKGAKAGAVMSASYAAQHPIQSALTTVGLTRRSPSRSAPTQSE